MKHDIEIVRGTSEIFKIAVADENGNSYALASGEKLVFGVKKKPTQDDSQCVLKKIITAASDNGLYEVKFDPADTASLPFGKYFYDVGLLSGNDYFPVIACEDGRLPVFHIKPNITKRGDGV